MKNLRLFVAIPSGRDWCSGFGMCMVNLGMYFSRKVPGFEQQQMRILNRQGSLLANMRQDMIEIAFKGGATHLLFIDSDQTFPHDIIHRFLAHRKQVVAANVATKKFPPDPTARLNDGTYAGRLCYTTPESKGLEEVWRIGTGVMLLDLNLFKREEMKKVPHWFDQRWDDRIGSYVGEDWGFCERLQAAGVKLYIDHDVSKEVGHIGSHTYEHDLIEATRTVEKESA